MEGVSLVYSNLAMSLYLFCSRGIFKSIGYSFGYHHIVFATWVKRKVNNTSGNIYCYIFLNC
jgi:hypothetical protein